jgi:hypothetical protein
MPLSQLACHVQGHMTTALADPMDLNPTLSRYRLDTSWPTSLTNAQERVMVVDSDLLAGLEDRAAGEHIALLTSPLTFEVMGASVQNSSASVGSEAQMVWAEPLVTSQESEPASPQPQLQSASMQNGLGSSLPRRPSNSDRPPNQMGRLTPLSINPRFKQLLTSRLQHRWTLPLLTQMR